MLIAYAPFRPFCLPFSPSFPLHFLLRIFSSNKYLLSTRLPGTFPLSFPLLVYKKYFNKCILPDRLSGPLSSLFRLFRLLSVICFSHICPPLKNAYCVPAFSVPFPFSPFFPPIFRYFAFRISHFNKCLMSTQLSVTFSVPFTPPCHYASFSV
jgi:hypothetical protein